MAKKKTKKVVAKKSSPTKKKSSATKAKASKKVAKAATVKNYFLTNDEVRAAKKENWAQIIDIRDHAEEVLSRNREMILSNPDVTAIHLGYKRILVETENGAKHLIAKPLTYAICVHVRKKMDPADPGCKWAIPAYFEGVPTDVVESEFQQSIALSPIASKTQPVAKLEGGVAIGREDSPGHFGTLGFVVSSLGDDVLLTNAHVAGPVNTKIVQPPSGPSVEIGVTTFSKFTSVVDGAIVFPTTFDLPTDRTILGLDIPSSAFRDAELMENDLNEEVFLVGAETGMKTGVVESISTEVNVAGRLFQNQIQIVSDEPLTGKGNSGAVVIQKETIEGSDFYNIVGLVHAESGTNKAIASPFRDVKRVLGVKLR